MNQCANLFLQSPNTTNTTNLDHLQQIVQEHEEGSLFVDCYRELLNQLYGQQVKNRLLEEECQRLHQKIQKHDIMIDSFEHDTNPIKPSKRPRERKSHPEPIPEEPRPDVVSVIRSNKSQVFTENSAVKQDTEFERQIKIILQAWDSQKSYINFTYPDQVSDFLESDKLEKTIDLVKHHSDCTPQKKPHQKKKDTPASSTFIKVQQQQPKTPLKFAKANLKRVRSLSQDAYPKVAPRTMRHVRALSTKKASELFGLETKSFAEKLLLLTTQIELKEEVVKVVVKPPPLTKQQPKVPQKQPSNYLKRTKQISTFEAHRQQHQQHQQQHQQHQQQQQRYATQHIMERMTSQITKFNIKDIIFETESEIADEYSRSSVQSKQS